MLKLRQPAPIALASLVLLSCSAGGEDGNARRSTPTGPVGSGSGSGGTGGTASTPWDPETPIGGNSVGVDIDQPSEDPSEDSCGIQSFDLERKPAEILLVLDRSASMQDEPSGGDEDRQKWELVVPAVTQIIRETDSGISWGLKLYPVSQDTDACSPETIVPDIHVPIANLNALNVVAAIDATEAEGDGTPTGDAIMAATSYLSELSLSSDASKYILLATDGEPSCSPSGEGQEDARPYAIDAITDAYTAGFPTFVVGVNTTKDSATETLNGMAIAGGMPRSSGADETSFYLANTQDELTEALRAITGEVATCVFSLDPPPPVPDNIAVDFNGMRTPRDPTRQDGWDYTSDDYSTVEVFGSFCEQIKTEAANRVQFLFGCPDEPVPPPT